MPTDNERHESVIAEQLADVLSRIKVSEHDSAVIKCAINRLDRMSTVIMSVPSVIGYQEAKEIFNYLMTEEELNATVNGWNECRNSMLNKMYRNKG